MKSLILCGANRVVAGLAPNTVDVPNIAAAVVLAAALLTVLASTVGVASTDATATGQFGVVVESEGVLSKELEMGGQENLGEW